MYIKQCTCTFSIQTDGLQSYPTIRSDGRGQVWHHGSTESDLGQLHPIVRYVEVTDGRLQIPGPHKFRKSQYELWGLYDFSCVQQNIGPAFLNFFLTIYICTPFSYFDIFHHLLFISGSFVDFFLKNYSHLL